MKKSSSFPRAPNNRSSSPPPRRGLGCLHVCIGLVAVLAGMLLALGVNERVNGSSDGGHSASDAGDAPRLGSGQMFDAVARHYDRMNKFMSLGMDQAWRRFLIEGLELRVTDCVLDLATGTADVALLAAEELRRKGLTPSEEADAMAGQPPVLGIDPSANMLALGREKVAARGLGGVVTLALGDAQALEGVASNSVDKIAMSFGIRNVEDRVAALREMARVLRKRPESRVGILEFQLPRSGVLKYVGDFMVRYGAPAIGALLTGLKDEYVHLRQSILEFPAQEGFAQLMREAGLEVVAVKETGFGVVALFLARPSEGLLAAAEAAAKAAGAGAGEGEGREAGR